MLLSCLGEYLQEQVGERARHVHYGQLGAAQGPAIVSIIFINKLHREVGSSAFLERIYEIVTESAIS